MIYYVNDSDGDTVILDKTFPDKEDAAVLHTVSPKKGRAVLFDVDFAEIGEIVDDALPFEPAAADRETVDQLLAQDEGEEGAEDVAADAGVGLVEDRAGGEQRLCGFEGILHG